MQTSSRAGTIALYALYSRLFIWAIAVASHALIQDYDSALELILPIDTPTQRLFKGVFGVFLRWDAFYFTHIAEKGYVFEQEHAFFPLVPALMRLMANAASKLLPGVLTYQQLIVISGVLVANASFILAAVQLYRLSRQLFRDEPFAFLSGLMYVLTPSGIFSSAIYTESTFAALTFTGMLFAAKRQYLLAAVTWSISSTARSNGILYAGFFVYDLVVRMDLHRSIVHKAWQIIKAIVLSLISCTGFAAVQAYGYSLYCMNDSSAVAARPWCDKMPPLIYTFVQDYYWYFEVKQIPNFLMAAPMIFLSTMGIVRYVQHDWDRVRTLGRSSRSMLIQGEGTSDGRATHAMAQKQSSTRKNRAAAAAAKGPSPFLSDAIFAHVVLWAVLLVTNVTTMHIQIITRAFSCMPPVYWYAAHQYRDGKATVQTMATTVFFVLYSLVGIILYANFFPPA
ncbi:hypothetical protein DFQ27_003119 [Actinomortierella ambigua]|uniref:GPI mannosyltransferase 2 n=1 Tax=Actinomortierella ambigua TaxID=1343610 RepID=A0A9P6U5A3_9FUNG|nr:hypothetical protein DFQ27_003119 [Actinomortierella ambigua]